MPRLLVVDDHAVIRRGIQSILRSWPEWNVCGEAANGVEALRLAEELKPEIIVMDLSMPVMSGLEATRLIRKTQPGVKILLLTLHDSVEWVETAFRAGVRGYLLKSDTERELLRALSVVGSDGIYLSPSFDSEHIKKLLAEM